MSDKALQKQLHREVARLQTEPRNPASRCDCAITMRKKDVQIQKMEKQMAELRKQRDLAESRLEDFMRMIEHHHGLKSGTQHLGNHTDKWEDGSVSDISGVVNLDTRNFISDDIKEELPMRSENPSDEYCREVQCIETEETATVYNNNNHNDDKEETKNVLGHSEDHANDETSVGVNHIDTVPRTKTPPENLGEDFLGRQESVFLPDFEFGSSVSRKDSMSSCEGNSSGIPTPLGEEGGISTIQTFVDGLKEMSKRYQEVSNADASGKMEREFGVEGDFKKHRQEILELWQSCNVSLVRRTYFYLLFKGDGQADSVYIGVELRRLLFIKDRFSKGKQALDGGETLTLASSLKALHKERKMLSKLLKKRFSEEERTRIYHKFGIAVNSKQRRLQLVNELWSNPKDMSQVVGSADVVSKLVKFTEQGKAMKEMFGLAFTHPSLLTPQKAHGWRKSMPTLF